MDDRPLSVVGLVGGESFGPGARDALARAGVVVGARRQLDHLPVDPEVVRVELAGPLSELFDLIHDHMKKGSPVCVLASGDPGFFGIVRALGARFGAEVLSVHPAPSSVSIAFARLGIPWDDALVVSAHGRSLADAAAAVVRAEKAVVFTSPENSPRDLGSSLIRLRCEPRRVVLVSRLGEVDESITHTDLLGLSTGRFDPLSVVVLLRDDCAEQSDPLGFEGAREALSGVPVLRWGLPEEMFEHRNRMITKSEVRAIALGKLALPPTGVLWDVGAGSGSVAVECGRLAPGLEIHAVERNAPDAARIRANAARHGVTMRVVEGTAPGILATLPDPDRVFVGGGGIEVLETARSRLRPNGVIVATYALIDHAAVAGRLLGNLVQISVSRGVQTGDAGSRLDAENPVFVCWSRDV